MKLKVIVLLAVFILMSALPGMDTYAALPKGVPQLLAAPSIEKAELLIKDEKRPIFQLQIRLPQSILDLDGKRPANGITNIEYYCKIDDGDWILSDGGYMDNLVHEISFKVPNKINTFYVKLYAFDMDDVATIDLKSHTYYFKSQLHYMYEINSSGDRDYIYSKFSNTISIGKNGVPNKPEDWLNASKWALQELQKAKDSGLIPNILVGTDVSMPITREEFCELAVLLYERLTLKKAEAAKPNPFKDTSNQQILKAYKLGITSGTSMDCFSPKSFITREQMAAMTLSAIKVIEPNGKYSITGIKDFPDQGKISRWAVEGAKYLSGIGIIKGDAKGNFMPANKATREMAIAIISKLFEKIPQFKNAESNILISKPRHPSQERLKLPEAFPGEIPFADDASIQQIVDDSAAKNFPSITLAYSSKWNAVEIETMYKEFLKADTDLAEQKMGDIYILTGHVSNYELSIVYLNNQVNLTVTFE